MSNPSLLESTGPEAGESRKGSEPGKKGSQSAPELAPAKDDRLLPLTGPPSHRPYQVRLRMVYPGTEGQRGETTDFSTLMSHGLRVHPKGGINNTPSSKGA